VTFPVRVGYLVSHSEGTLIIMRVFVDESGDTGFKFEMQSSRYFVLALVIFESEEKEAEASRRIHALRQELKSPSIEFHFAKNKDATRKAFFAAAKDIDFRAFVFVADKTRLSQSDKDSNNFYKSICGTAFERAKHLLRDANVVFDDSGGEKFKRELGSYLRRSVNKSNAKHIKNIGTGKSAGTSQASNLIQLADMVCGAMYRSLQGGDDAEAYRGMIENALEAVVLWPD